MKVLNRKVKKDFEILEKLEAGIVLTGSEVKSVKQGRVKLEGSFVKFTNYSAFLINAFIAPYKFADNTNYDPLRSRQLLLHKKEILKLKTKLKQARGLTVVPLSIYNKGHLIKVELALVRGRKKFEKKNVEKEKTIKKTIEREIKEYLRK